MDFYKFISLLAVFILIVCLAFVASALQVSQKDALFPPHISDCPDFFVKEGTTCKATYTLPVSTCDDVTFEAEQYKQPGMGRESGICKKKEWAQDCNVNWDGITNNQDVCHKTNNKVLQHNKYLK
jgi:hypothetical protein